MIAYIFGIEMVSKQTENGKKKFRIKKEWKWTPKMIGTSK